MASDQADDLGLVGRLAVACVVVLTCLVVSTATATAAAPATVQALTASGATALELEAWLERGGTTQAGRAVPTTSPPSGIPTASDWWMEEHRARPGTPSSGAMWDSLRSETQTLRNRAKLMPSFGALGTIVMGATAFSTGWEIGTALRSVFVDQNIAPAPAGYAFGTLVPKNKGETIVNGWTSPSTTWSAPGPGLSSASGGFEANGTANCAQFFPQLIMPAGFSAVTPTPNTKARDCQSQPAATDFIVPFKGIQIAPREGAQAGRSYQPRVGCSTCTNGTPASISADVLDQLQNHSEDYPTLNKTIDNKLGGPSADPLSVTTTVPSCTGDLYAACASKLTNAELSPVRTTLTPAEADITKPADAVVSTSPASGTQADKNSTVTVTANPGVATMPVLVPDVASGDTYATYLAKLQARGLAGTVTVLSSDNSDPAKGPDAVVSTNPGPGSRQAPGTTVTVKVNPADQPAPAPAPGATPGIDLSPLSQSSPCTKFPFGVPCWVVGALGGFSGSSACPSFDLPFRFLGPRPMHVDLCIVQPALDIVRPVLIFVSLLGLAWLFMGAAMGFGGKGGDE